MKRRERVREGARRTADTKGQARELRNPTFDDERLARQTYLTIPETRHYLRFSSNAAVYMWILRHRFPKCRRGRTVLLLRRDLDEAVQPAWRPGGAIHKKGA
jgi:hypothetical protein